MDEEEEKKKGKERLVYLDFLYVRGGGARGGEGKTNSSSIEAEEQ